MAKHPQLREVMTADVVTVDRSQPLSEVYDLLRSSDFHHVPVLEGDIPVGMISSTDVLKLVYDIEGADDRTLRTFMDHQFVIDDAMTTDLSTVGLSASVRDVAERLADGKTHSVIVLADDGKLAGIVTTTDLVRLLRDLL